MTELRGWQLPEQHLLPDAVVAFVDGELTASAHSRASAHLQRCPFCAAEAYSQQQARSAVRAAVVLCDVEGLSYEEIGATLGVKLGTVRSRIHRGRQALKVALERRRQESLLEDSA